MRIALMSRWNSACGVSLLAELVGREWVRMGHDLIVFAPNCLRRVCEDEPFVIRCYSDEGDHTETFFDPRPFLEMEYDIFVAQRIEWSPLDHFLKIFPEIRKRARTLYVIHERKPPSNPLFYELEWDAVVCFDERYVRQWRSIEGFGDRLRIIPYPTGPLRRGDRRLARERLGLGDEDEILIFSYGWKPELHVLPILPILERLSRSYDFRFLLLVDPESRAKLPELDFIEIRRERPPLDAIYDYLHASNLCIIHKERSEVGPGEVVVSSSVLMCLGALTPIMTSNTEFVSFLGDEIIKYDDLQDLERKLRAFLDGDLDLDRILRAAERYVRNNNPERIAEKYLRLFEELLERSR